MAAELIDDLSTVLPEARLANALERYVHPGLLAVDEIGYLTYSTGAANVLYHVVNGRHRDQHGRRQQQEPRHLARIIHEAA